MKSMTKTSGMALVLCIVATLTITPVGAADQTDSLSLKEFIVQAAANDTAFEAILLDQLPLQYRRDALLPDRDTIVALKQQFYYFQGGSGSAGTSLALNRLFADTGTSVSASYSKPATSTGGDQASLQVMLSQPIAKNAFGKAIALQDSIIGLENAVSRYQIVEAYEDYLASLTIAWYNWYSAYENLKVAITAYQSGQQLLANILARQRQKIALPVDVNKMKLSLIAKQENVIVLQEIYDNLSNFIYSALRQPSAQPRVPGLPDAPITIPDFSTEYAHFTQDSRTYEMLHLLEQQTTLEVDRAADDLLPSTNLLLGYQLDGANWGIRDQDNSFFAGIALTWPLGHTVDKAKYEITRIRHMKTQLSGKNKHEELHTNLATIYTQIQRERTLMDVSRRKIELADSILKDESENYSFGKISLNDYIAAVNDVDANRFNNTAHSVQLNKLLVEWLRLTDRLVDEKEVLR